MLSIYPKPKLQRRTDEGYFLSLNGTWLYETFKKIDKIEDLFNYSFKKKINVPYPYESSLSGVNQSLDKKVLVYYRKFNFVPKNSKTMLTFGAVDEYCEVYLNKNYLGNHLGGYLPFSFDISEYLKEENELLVIVHDKLNLNLPHGKQYKKSKGIWYTKTSGIWKDVYLESIPTKGIWNLKINADYNKEEIILKIDDYCDSLKNIKVYYQDNLIKEIQTKDVNINIKLDEIHSWSPEEPNLYDIVIENEGEIVKSYTNFRKLELKDYHGKKVFYLNDKPYYLHGLLDQGYYQDGLYTPKDQDTVYNDLVNIKKLGFNTLRKHIKIEEEYWYYLCDKLGILVWQDMVNSFKYSLFFESVLPIIGLKHFNLKPRLYSKKYKEFFIKHSQDTMKLLDNYQCIMLWTIFNEGWGQFEVNKVLKRVEPYVDDRFIDVCSGWFYNKHNRFDSRHIYFKPIKIDKIKSECLILSEFGGYSFNSRKEDLNEFGYKKYKTREEFNQAFYHLYQYEIIPNLEKGLAASIYTQVSDVENELNGIFSFDRSIIKLDEEVALKIKEELKF